MYRMIFTLKNIFLRLFSGLIILFAFFNPCPAQINEQVFFERYASENYKLEKGLSQNWIYSIFQDQYGYIWFGTWDGLNRFDGYNFRIFRIENGLSNNTIYSMLEDTDGDLWIGTNKGFNHFDRKTHRFTQYFHITGDTTSLVNDRINAIIQTRDGNIWIGTAGGLSKFDKTSGLFTSFFQTPQAYDSPRSNFILHLFEDNNGHLWISTTYGLVKFNPKDGRSTRYYHIANDPNSLSGNNIRCVVQDRNNLLWIGTSSGLNCFNPATNNITAYFHDPQKEGSLSDDWIRTLLVDSNGTLWVGTNNSGVNVFNPETNSFAVYRHRYDQLHSLSNDRVYSIAEDNIGNIWIGTFNGVNKIKKYAGNFNHVFKTSHDNKNLSNPIIWGFTEDKQNNLWIATSGGVNMYNPLTGNFTSLSHNPKEKNSLASNDVRSMLYCPEKDGFYFGTYGSGMDYYSINTNSFKNLRSNPNRNSIAGNHVNRIIRENHRILWIATGRGLSRFDEETGTFRNYVYSPVDTNSISNNIVICLLPDHKNNLWVGTDNGLNYFDTQTEQFQRFVHDPGNNNSLSHNTVFVLHKDKTGIIWIGTSGGGLNRYDPVRDEFTTYTIEQGLPNNIIYGILEDDYGHLWVSTNGGLSKFIPQTGQFFNYTVQDGIQSNEFNLGAYYPSPAGTMYFGGMNGYNAFIPDQIITNPNKPDVVITAFRKYNELFAGDIHNGDTITLKYDENFFSFEISALDFTNPSKNKYRYMLHNIDKNWVQVTSENRIAEYKMVSPGAYVFHAFGSNNDGVWNDEAISVTVIIRPAWYGTWAFRLAFGALLLTGAWMFVASRFRKIRQKNENERKMLDFEKQLFDLEQKALRLQMNPHFIFNSLNSIQSFILVHDQKAAITYLGKFSQLMRTILSNSSSKYITLKEELIAIRHYLDLEMLRFEDKFEYNISVPPDLDDDFLEIPPMILQPYVENAVIHGMVHKKTKGRLTVEVNSDGKELSFRIEDNGIGRERSKKIQAENDFGKKSQGMLITKARLDILNRQANEDYSVHITDLYDVTGNPAGTRVDLKLPYRES